MKSLKLGTFSLLLLLAGGIGNYAQAQPLSCLTAYEHLTSQAHPEQSTEQRKIFSDQDLLYGPSAMGALRRWQKSAGGRLLTDVPRSDPGQSITEFSIEVLDRQVARGGRIHFDLTNIQDLRGVLAGSGDYANKITSKELRHIQLHWSRFKDHTKFYRNGIEVPPPW
jgi:hypothetical protein